MKSYGTRIQGKNTPINKSGRPSTSRRATRSAARRRRSRRNAPGRPSTSKPAAAKNRAAVARPAPRPSALRGRNLAGAPRPRASRARAARKASPRATAPPPAADPPAPLMTHHHPEDPLAARACSTGNTSNTARGRSPATRAARSSPKTIACAPRPSCCRRARRCRASSCRPGPDRSAHAARGPDFGLARKRVCARILE